MVAPAGAYEQHKRASILHGSASVTSVIKFAC